MKQDTQRVAQGRREWRIKIRDPHSFHINNQERARLVLNQVEDAAGPAVHINVAIVRSVTV